MTQNLQQGDLETPTVRNVPVFAAGFVFGFAKLPEEVERNRESFRFRTSGLESEMVSGRLVSLEQVAEI